MRRSGVHERRSGDEGAVQASHHDLWLEAAVRETYEVGALLDCWFATHGSVSASEKQEALDVAVHLLDASTEAMAPDGSVIQRLSNSSRSSVLRANSAQQLLRVASATPRHSRSVAEEAFVSLLQGAHLEVADESREGLAALQLAAEWLQESGGQGKALLSEVRTELWLADFIRKLGGKDLDRFVGRSSLQNELLRAWSRRDPAGWFFVEGPGGIGKSLAITRFLVDICRHEDLRPAAVFHLDFDRPHLQGARELTILREIARQAVDWVPSETKLELKRANDQFLVNEVAIERPVSAHYSEEATYASLITGTVAEALAKSTGRNIRVIVFVDSFEQVDGFDAVPAISPARAIERLRSFGIQVFAIYASRAFSNPWNDLPGDVVRLRELSVNEAMQYLRQESRKLDIWIGERTLRKVIRAVGRSPLSLRLAVSLVEKAGGAIDEDQWADLAAFSPESRQSALYDRVLRRIRDPLLAKTVVPGLLLRRLSSDVIEKVLGPACGIDLNAQSADQLMRSAEKEGQLFIRDSADPGAVWHRPDVRSTMLRNIEREASPAVFQEINRSAAIYYRSMDGMLPLARTEELYHLLRLNASEEELFERWHDGSGAALRRASAEFPPEARRFIRRMLDAVQLSEVLQDFELGEFSLSSPESPRSLEADDKVDSAELRTFFSRELQAGSSTSLIIEQWEEQGKRLDVPMGDVFASGLVRANRHGELIALAPTVLAGAASISDFSSARCSVLCIAAAIHEGRGSLATALGYWAGAVGMRDFVDDAFVVFTSMLGFIRISRKCHGDSMVRERMRSEAMKVMLNLGERLEESPVSGREAIGELGRAIYSGSLSERRLLESLISRLAEENEVFPSVSIDPARRMKIRSTLGLVGKDSSASDVNSSVMNHLHGGAKRQSKLISEVRREVDWQLLRSAWPKK